MSYEHEAIARLAEHEEFAVLRVRCRKLHNPHPADGYDDRASTNWGVMITEPCQSVGCRGWQPELGVHVAYWEITKVIPRWALEELEHLKEGETAEQAVLRAAEGWVREIRQAVEGMMEQP